MKLSSLSGDGSPSSASLSLGHCVSSSQRSQACQAVCPVKAAVSLQPALWLCVDTGARLSVWVCHPSSSSYSLYGLGSPGSHLLGQGWNPSPRVYSAN